MTLRELCLDSKLVRLGLCINLLLFTFRGPRLHNTRLEGSGSHRCAARMCAPVVPTPRAAAVHQKRHTLASVAQHATPDDCWLIVRGKVYDVTGWAAQHPGGALIFVKAGGECTQLFDSYHPLSARRGPQPERAPLDALAPRPAASGQCGSALDSQASARRWCSVGAPAPEGHTGTCRVTRRAEARFWLLGGLRWRLRAKRVAGSERGAGGSSCGPPSAPEHRRPAVQRWAHKRGRAHACSSFGRAPMAAPAHQHTAWSGSSGDPWQVACESRALLPAVAPAPELVRTALSRRRVLDKLCVGSLEAGERVVAYEEDLEDGQFFAVLKKRVEKYFRGNQARARAAPPSRARAACLPAPLAACLACDTRSLNACRSPPALERARRRP